MIILDLLLTIFIYLAFPTIYVSVKGRVAEKKAKKIALINVIICAVIFEIIQSALFANDPTYIPSMAPAFLYYFISTSILTDKTTSQKGKTNEEKEAPKTLILCNSCKYNEHTFCKYKDCENCPNWKQDPNNKNNYYCMCDEYEQSNNEQCPYYIPAEESPNVDEEENNNDDTPIEEKFSNYLSTSQSIEDEDTK